MADPQEHEIYDLLLRIVRALVDEPEDVKIEILSGDERTVFRIRVSPQEIGIVIGKQGRTAKSIRTIVGAIGARSGRTFSVEIAE